VCKCNHNFHCDRSLIGRGKVHLEGEVRETLGRKTNGKEFLLPVYESSSDAVAPYIFPVYLFRRLEALKLASECLHFSLIVFGHSCQQWYLAFDSLKLMEKKTISDDEIYPKPSLQTVTKLLISKLLMGQSPT
jgi:hypothetical protein